MGVFSSKKRKAVTLAVNCLLGAAVAAGGLLGDAAVAKAEVLAKYTNGTIDTIYIVASDKTKPLEFYSSDSALAAAVGEYNGDESIAGGYSAVADVVNAKVIIHGGKFLSGINIGGGMSTLAVTGNTTGNTLTISGGTFEEGITFFGGYSYNGASTGNTVTISGGTFNSFSMIYGGRAYGDATNNTVTISGGTFNSPSIIYGGYSSGGAASGNTVNITAGCDLSNVQIMGGYAPNGDDSGNTLNIKASGVKAQSIAAFNNLNFYVPAAAVNGDTMLKVDSATDLTGATIKAGVATGSGLKKDDTINLLKATSLEGEADSMTADLTGTGLVKINGTVEKVDNSIVLTMKEDVSNSKSQELAEESKSLVETRAGGMALLNTAFDLTTGKGFANAQAAAEAENNATDDGVTKNTEGIRAKAGFTPYVAVGGANMTYETGSYVDSKGWGINVGFSRIINYENSKLTLAPFVEYGKASYDSYLENAANTHGSGDNSFTGIGFMAKNEQKDGLYYEGSVRFGRAKGDYQGDASTYGSNYDTASNYLAFHAGIGKVQKLNDKNSIDYYGKFFYTHQNGDTVNIHSTLGDASYDFDAINSYRLRLGARWSQKLGQRDKLYAGLAWDYEFDSEARAHYRGASTPAPSMKGSSGMLELGWKQESTKENPFGVDVGVTGWCGKQRGVQFNAGFSWAF